MPTSSAERLAVRLGPLALPNPVICGSGEPVMTEAAVKATPREQLESEPNLARALSALLRKHFESQFHTLRHKGFMIEPDRRANRRAYFFGEGGGPRHVPSDCEP